MLVRFWLDEDKIKDPANASERQYHAVTRDWITNEIFRRVEPNSPKTPTCMKNYFIPEGFWGYGRTMGEYIRDDQKTFGDIYISTLGSEILSYSIRAKKAS